MTGTLALVFVFILAAVGGAGAGAFLLFWIGAMIGLGMLCLMVLLALLMKRCVNSFIAWSTGE